MDEDQFLESVVRMMYDNFVVPQLEDAFPEGVPAPVVSNVSAALFLILTRHSLTTVTKGLILATVDDAIRAFRSTQ